MTSNHPKKVGQMGVVDHFLILVGFVVLIGLIGTYILVKSNAATACDKQTFVKGSSGKCVKNIQSMLNGLVAAHQLYGSAPYYVGYYGSMLSTDGIYGSLTAGQVGYFQTTKGLLDDSKVGPATWPKLCSATNDIPILTPIKINYTNEKLLNTVTNATSAAANAGC
jgi:peptidoglycan hydrolase-like protein with peptidoglycan-binding domain